MGRPIMTSSRRRTFSRLVTASQPMIASRPMTASRLVTASLPRIASCPMTSSRLVSASQPMTASRPMIASCPMTHFHPMTDSQHMRVISGASNTSSTTCDSTNDPSDMKPTLEAEDECLYEMKTILEKDVNELVKESWIAQSQGDCKLALEKAKEAGKKMRELMKHWQESGEESKIKSEITFTVLLNLANQFENNEMYPEALNTYQVMLKDRHFNDTGLLRLNMANIYVKQKIYPKAIKIYCSVLDQTNNCHKESRVKLKQNIGVVFVHMRRYQDAIGYFEEVMRESPNVRVGYNLVLCYYAIGDKKKMRDGFEMLILAPLGTDDEVKHCLSEDDTCPNATIGSKNDKLHQKKEAQTKQAETYIMTAAKLIAPAIETSVAAGLDWCMNMVKISQNYKLARDLEYAKAIAQLKQKDFKPAFEILNTFDLKDGRLKGDIAINISLYHFLDKNYDQADKYANLSLMADPCNPKALVNKGNAVFSKQGYKMAVEYYKEALKNDSTCTEALYNLGLCYKKLNHLEEALNCFLELHTILGNDNQVIYQLVNLYALLGDNHQAIEMLMHIINSTPNDPNALAKLGQLHNAVGNKLQAYKYYNESFKLFPCNMEVIEWLAMYHIETQSCGKAVQLFERAAILHPTQVRWRLYVAACYRRNGDYQKALERYKHIHLLFPEDVECLRFLVSLCTDMGLEEAEKYTSKLEKLKRNREQRLNSGRLPSARDQRENAEGNTASVDSINSAKQEKRRSQIRSIITSDKPFEVTSPKQLDAFYVDPLGPQMERPRMGKNMCREAVNFKNEILGANLLP